LQGPTSSQRCVRVALVREPLAESYGRRGDGEVCSSRHVADAGRERTVYLSESNELEVEITTDIATDAGANDNDYTIFLLRYDGTCVRKHSSHYKLFISYINVFISAKCNIYISRLCYDVSVLLSVRLSVTEVHCAT